MYYDRRSTAVRGNPRPIRTSQPEDWQGVDLAIDYEREDFDLLNSSRDLGTIDGAQSIVTALLRRLATQTGGYHRYYRTSTGIRSTGGALENRAYAKLSSPKSQSLVNEIIQHLKTAAGVDGRIEITNVSGFSNPGQGPLQFTVQYRVKGQTQLRSLNYRL